MPDLHTLDGERIDAVPAAFALYPFGVFTTLVVVEGTALGWGDHRRRLGRDARTLWGHELDEARLHREVRAHVALLDGPATVRITLYPDGLSLASPGEARGCRILVSSGPASFPFAPRSDLTVRVVEYERELPQVKSTALFTQLRLRREAQLAGYDDVLFARGEEVLEGATWTVLAWRDGEVATPRAGVLESITAVHLGHLAETRGWRFRQRGLGVAELASADLVLAVNTNFPARAIRRIDHTELAVDEDLLATIADDFSALARDPIQ